MMHQIIAQVTPKLWIGSYPFELDTTFDKLIVCAKDMLGLEKRYPNTCVIYAPLNPRAPTTEDATCAIQTGRAVAGWLRRDKKVLVTCSTGYNRAPLIAAIALMSRGMSSTEAIKTIRGVLPDALYNESFLGLLRDLENVHTLRPLVLVT